MTRRPLHSAGLEVIGLGKYWRDFPYTARRLIEHMVRIGPYYLPTAKCVDSLPEPPESPWSQRVLQTPEYRRMSEEWREHSIRTWHFAAATTPSVAEDPDLYVASLLHDIGLFAEPEPGESFAHAGARIALSSASEAHVHPDLAKPVADAIRDHISVKPDTALSSLVQIGSLLDLTASGIWKLDRGLVATVYRDHPRTGYAKEARARWQIECERLPLGRAAYARRPGLLVAATRIAPLSPFFLRASAP